MIVYWWKNLAKKSNQKNENLPKFKSMNEMTYVSPIFPENDNFQNKNLSLPLEDNILSNKNDEESSFLSEDSFFIDDENDKNEDNFIRKEKNSNFPQDNFKNLDYYEKKQLISNIFEQKDNLFLNILSLFNLCERDEDLFNFILEKINSNILLEFLKSKENILIFNKLFQRISSENKSYLINKILKKTNELIPDESGHRIILLLISFNEIRIINVVLYFILQKFLFYCNNPFSSKIIIALYSTGAKYISNQLNEELIQNLNEISQLSYGISIINEAKKHF